MRKTCLECVAKHLGSAAVYIEECELGYPNYYGFVYGELDHAASECLDEIPELAWTIREHRIRWAETRRSENHHVIPFEAMFDYIDTVEEVGEVLEVPEAVYAGLTKGDDGRPVFSMDTRPSAGGEKSPPMLKPDDIATMLCPGIKIEPCTDHAPILADNVPLKQSTPD